MECGQALGNRLFFLAGEGDVNSAAIYLKARQKKPSKINKTRRCVHNSVPNRVGIARRLGLSGARARSYRDAGYEANSATVAAMVS